MLMYTETIDERNSTGIVNVGEHQTSHQVDASEQEQDKLLDIVSTEHECATLTAVTVVPDSPLNYRQFLCEIFQTKGVPEILTVALLLGFGIGSVVGLVR
jgi:hypothetical protein